MPREGSYPARQTPMLYFLVGRAPKVLLGRQAAHFGLARHLRLWAVSPLARHDDPLGRLKRNTITFAGFDILIICDAKL